MRQGGFSLLELAVVLAVLGLMAWGVSTAYGNTDALREREFATQTGETLRETLRAFALTNARLPCPDTDGNGWEGGAAGTCPANTETGWFPYRSLGMDLPDARYRAAYGVYRAANVAPALDADLAVKVERSADLPGDPHYQDARDLVIALNTEANAALSTNHVRLTGNDGNEGAVDCAGNVRSHPAYFVVFPLQDRNGDTDRFDSVHGIGNACAYASGTALAANRDDIVMAESATTLAGWLSARVP